MKKVRSSKNGSRLLPFQSSRFSIFKKVAWALILVLSLQACKKAVLEDQKVADSKAVSVQNPSMQLLAASSGAFKVMSFNTRHNDASDPHSITFRRDLIKQIIVDNAPDIFGLQEFTDDSFEAWFLPQMTSLGYNMYYDTTITSTPKAIFFKSNRFTLLDSGTKRIMHERTATWAILQDQTTAKKYFISNSHWDNDPDINRQDNVRELVEMVNDHNTENLTTIVFGDFNAKPGTTEINYLKSNLDVVDGLMEDENTYHGWDATATSKLDWIMSTKDIAVLKYDVIRTSYGGDWPSDHFPVMVTYVPALYGAANNDATGSGSSNSQFSFADVDGDGKKDKILWRNNFDSGKPRVYLSTGTGTFSSSFVSHTAGASGVATTKYYYADVDGDGKADQIVWNPGYTSGQTRVYLATTGGNFSGTAILQSGSTSTETRFYFADVNGDGKADKIYWNPTYDSGNNRVYFATTGGSFSTAYTVNTNASSESTTSTYYYADINGDGKSDKILWHPSNNDGKTMVYLSNGDGNFTLSTTYSEAGPSSTATTRYYFADVNGDGRADKIFWRPNAYLGKSKIYLSKSTGAFDTPIYSLRSASTEEETKLYFADINGDGKADQLFWNNNLYSGDFKNYFAL
jgi:endonuclease/exonuclease/phosphatase family metal-dependent hydrolase